MATSAIGATDLTSIRNTAHQLTAVRLNCVRPVKDVTYSITPGTQAIITDITGTISDGVVGDVLTGKRVVLTDGTYNQTTTIRKSSDATNLYLNALGEGDTGFADTIFPAQSDLDTAYVYNDFPLYGEYSRVVSKAIPILPRWDLAYASQTSTSIPPIANAGTHQSDSIAVGGSASFTLPKGGSNTSFAFNSETISSHAWVIPTGVTLQGGFALTDAVIGVDATVGQHLISYTTTDSNSEVHTAYVWLFVDDGTTYKTLNDEFQAKIVSDNRDLTGRTLELELTGQIADTVMLQGTLFHLQTEQTYGGDTLTEGVVVDIFVGYVQNILPSYDGNIYTTRLTIVSPTIYLQNVAVAPQVIFEKSSPANWTEVTSALSNPRGALSYVRWQCQNLFAMHDIDCSLTTPRKKSYQFVGTTIASHFDVIAQAISGNIGSASDGTLVVRQNPSLEDNTFRNALAVGCIFSASDIVGQIEYTEPIHFVFQDIRAGGFGFDGSKSNAWYGVKRWGQGAGRTELPTFSVDSSGGRDSVLERVGHLYASENYPITNSITLSRDFDVIDPVYMIWYRLNIASTYDARGKGWSNIRVLPSSVSVNWDLENFTKEVSFQYKEETFGQPAEEYFIGSASTNIANGWLTSNPVPFTPTASAYGMLGGIAILLNTVGQLAITQNLLDASPNYIDLSPFVTGTVCDVTYDYNSAFFTSGYVLTEILSIYIVSASSTTLYIYRLDDIKAASFIITELTTYTMGDASTTTGARIRCSRTTPTFVVMAFHDQTGVQVGRSTDTGATWASLTRVGASVTDLINDNAELGLYVDGANQVVSAPDSSNDYAPYLATTTGGAFSVLANSVLNVGVNPMIVGDGATTIYVTTQRDDLPPIAYDIDFDDLTPLAYTVTAFVRSVYTTIVSPVIPDSSFGNPQPSMKGAFVSLISNGNEGFFAGTRIVFTNTLTIRQVDFEYWMVSAFGQVLERKIILYDVSDVVLDSYTVTGATGTESAWTTVTRFFNEESVKKIEVWVAVVGTAAAATPSNTKAWLDNIEVTGFQ